GIDGGGDQFALGPDVGDRRGDRIDHDVGHPLAYRRPQLRLVGEVAVENRLADAGDRGHLGHVDVRSELDDRFGGGRDQLSPPFGPVAVPSGTPSVRLGLDRGIDRLHDTLSNRYSPVQSRPGRSPWMPVNRRPSGCWTRPFATPSTRTSRSTGRLLWI